jgi:hypothetical protein
MNDWDIMPFGPYEGKTMGVVPGKYLLNLWKKRKLKGPLAEYVRKNEVLLYRKERNEPFCAKSKDAS